MTTAIDTQNPAVAKNLDLPPALLEAIRDSPEMMQPLARSMAAVMANDLFVSRAGLTAPQQQSLMESFAKLGNLHPKEAPATQVGAGYKLVINIGTAPSETFTGTTVDVIAEKVVDADV